MVAASPAEIGLLAAADDPELLGSVSLWPKQRELLGAIDSGPRLHVVDWGARASKTTTSATAALWMALLRPGLRRVLRPRERAWGVCVATNLDQAKIWLDAARNIVRASPLLSGMVEGDSEYELTFSNNMGLRALSCTSRSIRGYPIFCLVLDEFAHHVDSENRSVAERVWTAATARTLQFGADARILVLSTPAGAQGMFFDLWQRADGGDLPGARAWKAASWEVNPTLDEETLEAERILQGPDVFDAEYGAEFTAGEGVLFDRPQLERVVGRPLAPEEGRGWLAALDPSSGGGDPFAMIVAGRDARPGYEGRLAVGHVERWLPRSGVKKQNRARKRTQEERDYWVGGVLDGVALQVRRFAASVVSDSHIPGVVMDELYKRGVGNVRVHPWTAHSRLQAFQQLRARVQTERITLADDEQLLAELSRVRTRWRGGGVTVDIGRAGSSHGDLGIALALAVHQLDLQGAAPRRARVTRLQDPWGDASRRLGVAGR